MNPAHFVLMVKKNQPQSYEEIVKYFGATSDVKTFLEKGSRRSPKPVQDEETGPVENRDDLRHGTGAEEIRRIKREHWSVEPQ